MFVETAVQRQQSPLAADPPPHHLKKHKTEQRSQTSFKQSSKTSAYDQNRNSPRADLGNFLTSNMGCLGSNRMLRSSSMGVLEGSAGVGSTL
jgi:hypothetical protein